jgi:hypothetical protein
LANTTLEIFVRDALNQGQGRQAISNALLAAGWTAKEVDAALECWISTDFGLAAPRPKPYVSAREAFLFLVFFLLLGIVAFNLGSLLFALIDLRVADVLDVSRPEAKIRGAIAALVVGTPLFAWLGWRLSVQRRSNPAMQRSPVRKWLTYVTLIIAASVLVGAAIGLVYNFLAGELSARLGLKMFVLAALAGGVFIYFIRDAEQGDENEPQA